jgi:hypothetical protein
MSSQQPTPPDPDATSRRASTVTEAASKEELSALSISTRSHRPDKPETDTLVPDEHPADRHSAVSSAGIVRDVDDEDPMVELVVTLLDDDGDSARPRTATTAEATSSATSSAPSNAAT